MYPINIVCDFKIAQNICLMIKCGKPQVDYGEIKYGTVLNESISWPDTALARLGISKEEKSLE